ncbi:hypothetical protein ACLBWT_04315 [Paenibacillus sp. D51F]
MLADRALCPLLLPQAGAALLLAAHPGLPPAGAASVLKRCARRLPGYGSRSQGAGLLQLGRIGSVCLPAAKSCLHAAR